jgi:hypothetical protein
MHPVGRVGPEQLTISCCSAKLWPSQQACNRQPHVVLRNVTNTQANMHMVQAVTPIRQGFRSAHTTLLTGGRGCQGALWTSCTHSSSRREVMTAAAAQPQPPDTNEDEQQQASSSSSSSETPQEPQRQHRQEGSSSSSSSSSSRPTSGSSSGTRSPFSIDDPQLLVGDCVALVAAALYR